MRYLCVILLLAAACARCQPSPSKAIPDSSGKAIPSTNAWGEHVSPITDADPSIRHAVTIRIPINLEAKQQDDWLIYGFSALQTTNVTVGYKMVTGVNCEGVMDCDGVRHPLFREGGGLEFINTSTDRYNMVGPPKADLESGTHCVFEYQVTVFETDIPAQHHWMPTSGKLYKVLWTHTFRKTLK